MPDAVLLVGDSSGEKDFQVLSRTATLIVHSPDEAQRAFLRWKSALWVVFTGDTLDTLIHIEGPTAGDKRLIVLGPVSSDSIDSVQPLFRNIVSAGKGLTLLPKDEMAEILADTDRSNYVLAGKIDQKARRLILFRGNLESIVVPWKWFFESSSTTKPDFKKLALIDFGQTVKLGTFEASVDSILYAFDPEYRKRAKKLAFDEDNSLGGCLRRLRLFKGFTREDFEGIVSSKELGRIERGEVTPHRQTLVRIAKKLEVQLEEIESY